MNSFLSEKHTSFQFCDDPRRKMCFASSIVDAAWTFGKIIFHFSDSRRATHSPSLPLPDWAHLLLFSINKQIFITSLATQMHRRSFYLINNGRMLTLAFNNHANKGDLQPRAACIRKRIKMFPIL